MKISYYPGCTLKNNAKNFEDSALYSLKHLGVEVEELPRWNCCGTVFSLTTDDLIHHLAPIRNLIRTKELNSERLLTLCAMCYNTLKRANERVKNDPDSLDVINNFMEREKVKYDGGVKVVHLLELLRDEIKFKAVEEKVVNPLRNLKVASYYGCLLVRPREIGLDDIENPTILENLVQTLGAEAVDFPYKTECCGAYHTVNDPKMVAERTFQIITSALTCGAEAMVVSCPLCAFNLDHRQKETVAQHPEFKGMPVLYFTQAMALAFGCVEKDLGFKLHYVNPKPLLAEKGLI
ncbi:MAG: CoB--CoM heterodisulfide reductase iron-sulfur subunit B family protein [Candidatus Aminicenantales bacterium]